MRTFGDVEVGTIMISMRTGDMYICERINPVTEYHVSIRWKQLIRDGRACVDWVGSIYANDAAPSECFFA